MQGVSRGRGGMRRKRQSMRKLTLILLRNGVCDSLPSNRSGIIILFEDGGVE